MDDDLYPTIDVNLNEVNYIDIKANSGIVRENYEITIQNCIPRPVPGCYNRPKAKKQRKPWSIPISLFKDYIVDTEVLWSKCFEEDWKRLVKPKMKEENLAKCKELLKANYKTVKEAYKYYAALGKTENLFSINKLTLTDFIAHKIFLFDGDKLTDMDLTFSSVKGRPKVAKFQPRTALIRFEFLEMMFRLALKKYYDSIL